MNESEAQKLIRLQYAKMGCLLWRNNVGVAMDASGMYVRYGLANESKQMNEHIKSSDLIGIQPVVITPGMVGHTIGQFMALECKRPDWRWTGTDREWAQWRYLELVRSVGGYAEFTQGPVNETKTTKSGN